MRLVVLKSNIPISEFHVPDGEIDEGFEVYVGRSEDCHILIDDPLISRHHFVIRYTGDKWKLEKLSNMGLLIVNGVAVQESALSLGDIIGFPPYSMMATELKGGVSYQPPAAVGISANQPNDEPTIDDMLDDLPTPVSTEEATEVMQAAELVINEEKDLASLDSEAIEGPQGDAAAAADDMNFGGEEEVIGSSQEGSLEDSTFGGAETEAGFSAGEDATFGGEETALDTIDNGSSGDGESTRVFQSFASYELVLFGELAPYDKFTIDAPETFIGRDTKKCQIILNDPEVSSVHAVIRKNMISLVIEDLNSSNGTLLNGARVNKAELSNGDEFVIGSTSFTVQVSSDLLQAESDRLMPVESGQFVETIEEVEEEVDIGEMPADGNMDFAGAEAPKPKSLLGKFKALPTKKKIIYVAILVMVIMLLPSEEEKKTEVAEGEKKDAPAKPVDPNANPNTPVAAQKRKLSEEEIRALTAKFKLAEDMVKQGKLAEALTELESISAVDKDFNNVTTLIDYVKKETARLKQLEEEKKKQEALEKIRQEVKELVAKAEEAVKDRNVTLAESLFANIAQKDPENIRVQQLKLELEGWQQEEQRKAAEKARKEAERKRMVDALNPGKTFYLKKDWFKAILKLEEFLAQKGMDEDLVKNAGDMLADSKNQLAAEIAPMLGKARSMKEGQDLKGAYEAYNEVLKIDPGNTEALNEVDDIRTQLDTRSKKVYREAIIAESLSLFSDAKEKFQEVQQISPTDSDYYRKATEKLKNYLE